MSANHVMSTNGFNSHPEKEVNGNVEVEELNEEISELNMNDRRKPTASIYRTARTKLHDKRVSVNKDIDKQLRLLSGANNLLRVVRDRRLQGKVQLEIDYVHSNLHLLKDELDGINSSLDVYQDKTNHLPLIPLGLKGGNHVDFLIPFSDYILEHYSEDPRPYQQAISDVNALRKRAVDPTRNEEGLRDVHEYIAALNVIDARFFPPGRNINVHFEWFDSFTGESKMQSSIAFEKGAVLFNLAALYTQLAVREDVETQDGCDLARSRLCSAAGLLRVLRDSFTHAPSADLRPQTLGLLIPLMLAQAQECHLARLAATSVAADDGRPAFEAEADAELNLACEAAWLAEAYERLATVGLQAVPALWMTLVRVKASVFAAESSRRAARCLLALCGAPSPVDPAAAELLREVHARRRSPAARPGAARRPRTCDDIRRLARAMIAEALSALEDALSTVTAARGDGGTMGGLRRLLDAKQTKFQQEMDAIAVEDSLGASFVAFDLVGRTSSDPVPQVPDGAIPEYKDPFAKLGPMHIFSSRHFWSPPRRVPLTRHPKLGYGFSIRGDAPVLIVDVDEGGPAELGGIKPGDFIVDVNDQDTKWAKHEAVIEMVKQTEERVALKIVTPLDMDYLRPGPPRQSSASAAGSISSRRTSLFSKQLGPRYSQSGPTDVSSTMPTKGGSRRWRPRLSGGSLFSRRRNSSKSRASYDFS